MRFVMSAREPEPYVIGGRQAMLPVTAIGLGRGIGASGEITRARFPNVIHIEPGRAAT